MQPNDLKSKVSVAPGRASELATNSVLRNTYLLLGMTLLFSAATASFSVMSNVAMPSGWGGILMFFGCAYGLMFLTSALRNSVWGIAAVFAFTGFMGFTLGPLLNSVLTLSNGGELIVTALGGTGLIFFALSGYALTTRKDFSFLTGFVIAGSMVLLLAIIGSLFFQSSAFHLAISAGLILLSSAVILWQTSLIIHGGERNYIMATVGLYVQLYNLFVSLLHLLTAFSGRD